MLPKRRPKRPEAAPWLAKAILVVCFGWLGAGLPSAPTLIQPAKIASGVRAWSCTGPRTASKSVPEALE
eukprot:1974013-Alexandrium_andersonii.AAC.1